jgi:DNA-3-methyladenine glycosylase
MAALLPQSFYARDALVVAEELLGHHIHHGEVVLRITEVEAYRHPGDSANHCRMGKTSRNAPMWGPAGHAYVYLCYGMHSMLNFVTDREDEGAAVLIRACEVVQGLPLVLQRRHAGRTPVRAPGSDLLAGPGKVCMALAIDRTFSGHCLFRRGGLEVRRGTPPSAILRGPRIGIAYASELHQAAPWRLAAADSRAVSQRSQLHG